MSPPHISVRDSINWIHGPGPYEPTSTIVLTSPERRFVDIRILKESPEPIPDTARDAALFPLSLLDWAFAGTSWSQPSVDVDGLAVTRCVWRHEVDSRERDAGRVVDAAEMHTLADGRALERGQMVYPGTGQTMAYEEVWREVEAGTCGGGGGGRPVMCVVVEMRDEECGARGVVVRLGQVCQGIVRVGEALGVERWEWREGEGEGWRRTARMGDLFLPCGLAMEEEKVALGTRVAVGELVWTVVERWDGDGR